MGSRKDLILGDVRVGIGGNGISWEYSSGELSSKTTSCEDSVGSLFSTSGWAGINVTERCSSTVAVVDCFVGSVPSRSSIESAEGAISIEGVDGVIPYRDCAPDDNFSCENGICG